MELAIIAGLGLVGFHMSSGGSQARPGVDPERRKPLPKRDEYPDAYEQGTKGAQQIGRYNAEARKKWNQSLMPHLTGVVSPNTARDISASGMLPFFKSERTQGTNDAMKQRRLEMYTGALDMGTSSTGTYRNKTEVPLEHPANPQEVRSSGSQGNPVSARQMERFAVPRFHNNVAPTPQVRVGPGLGLSAEAPATDGFHPMLRILPSNLDVEMRKNELGPTATVAGFNRIASGTNPVAVAKNRPDNPTVQSCNRPLAKSRAAATAQAYHPTEDGRAGIGKVVGGEYFGGAASVTSALMETAVTEGRDRSDAHGGLPVVNLTGAAYGVGGFVNGEFETGRFASQQREMHSEFGFLSSQNKARVAPAGQLLPATNRDLTRRDTLLHAAMTPTMPVGESRPMQAPRATLRQQYVTQTPMTNVKAGFGTTMTNATREVELYREAKRGSQVTSRINAPGRMNVRKPDGAGRTRFKVDHNPRCQSALPTVRTNTKYGAAGKLTSNFNKLDDAHPYAATFDLVRNQLGNNPYAMPAY